MGDKQQSSSSNPPRRVLSPYFIEYASLLKKDLKFRSLSNKEYTFFREIYLTKHAADREEERGTRCAKGQAISWQGGSLVCAKQTGIHQGKILVISDQLTFVVSGDFTVIITQWKNKFTYSNFKHKKTKDKKEKLKEHRKKQADKKKAKEKHKKAKQSSERSKGEKTKKREKSKKGEKTKKREKSKKKPRY